MGVRDGKSYVAGLKAHPRDVWVAGRKVADVTTDPVFRRPVAAMARLYDCQVDPALHSTMSYLPEDGGAPAGVSFIIPRSHADLVHRRKAMQVWAETRLVGPVGPLGPVACSGKITANETQPESPTRKAAAIAREIIPFGEKIDFIGCNT